MAKTTKASAKPTAERAAKADAVSRREQRRLQVQDLSRTQLLDAAEEVFGSKGFHDATLKEVAELAEFSVGSVYSFFENKDDLFLQVFLRRGVEFMAGLEAITSGQGSATEVLERLVEYEIRFFREHHRFGRLYFRYSSPTLLSPDRLVDQGLAVNFERSMAMQADVFARGQATGELRAGDPLVFARLFSGLVAAYQSIDPAIMSDDPTAAEPYPLADLQSLVLAAFRA
jgi:AcrR family transcriptional regulator